MPDWLPLADLQAEFPGRESTCRRRVNDAPATERRKVPNPSGGPRRVEVTRALADAIRDELGAGEGLTSHDVSPDTSNDAWRELVAELRARAEAAESRAGVASERADRLQRERDEAVTQAHAAAEERWRTWLAWERWHRELVALPWWRRRRLPAAPVAEGQKRIGVSDD